MFALVLLYIILTRLYFLLCYLMVLHSYSEKPPKTITLQPNLKTHRVSLVISIMLKLLRYTIYSQHPLLILTCSQTITNNNKLILFTN